LAGAGGGRDVDGGDDDTGVVELFATGVERTSAVDELVAESVLIPVFSTFDVSPAFKRTDIDTDSFIRNSKAKVNTI